MGWRTLKSTTQSPSFVSVFETAVAKQLEAKTHNQMLATLHRILCFCERQSIKKSKKSELLQVSTRPKVPSCKRCKRLISFSSAGPHTAAVCPVACLARCIKFRTQSPPTSQIRNVRFAKHPRASYRNSIHRAIRWKFQTPVHSSVRPGHCHFRHGL